MKNFALALLCVVLFGCSNRMYSHMTFRSKSSNCITIPRSDAREMTLSESSHQLEVDLAGASEINSIELPIPLGEFNEFLPDLEKEEVEISEGKSIRLVEQFSKSETIKDVGSKHGIVLSKHIPEREMKESMDAGGIIFLVFGVPILLLLALIFFTDMGLLGILLVIAIYALFAMILLGASMT